MQWIRIWTHKTLQSTTFQELDLLERGMWFSLLIMAGSNERNQGIVELRDGIAFSPQTLAELLGCKTRELNKAIKHLKTVEKIEILPDGRIKIVNFEKYQTRYVKYYKDKKADNGIRDGTPMHDRKDKKRIDKNRTDIHTGKTPTREMIAIFTKIFKELRDGTPQIDRGKCGGICKVLYKQCLADRPSAPLELWEERIRTLMTEHHIASLGGIKAFWNTGIPEKKDQKIKTYPTGLE